MAFTWRLEILQKSREAVTPESPLAGGGVGNSQWSLPHRSFQWGFRLEYPPGNCQGVSGKSFGVRGPVFTHRSFRGPYPTKVVRRLLPLGGERGLVVGDEGVCPCQPKSQPKWATLQMQFTQRKLGFGCLIS